MMSRASPGKPSETQPIDQGRSVVRKQEVIRQSDHKREAHVRATALEARILAPGSGILQAVGIRRLARTVVAVFAMESTGGTARTNDAGFKMLVFGTPLPLRCHQCCSQPGRPASLRFSVGLGLPSAALDFHATQRQKATTAVSTITLIGRVCGIFCTHS